LHYAIQKHGWRPSEVDEWLNRDAETKALYFASMELRAEQEMKRERKMNKAQQKAKGRRRK